MNRATLSRFACPSPATILVLAIGFAITVCQPGATFQLPVPAVVFEVVAHLDGGTAPFGGVIRASDGFYYGTTNRGGRHGHGTVFRMTADGGVTVVHDFMGGAGGSQPFGELVEGGDGRLYGTTWRGGNQFNQGTVYAIELASGNHVALDTFNSDNACDVVNGPLAGLTSGPDGLYGIGNGISGCGNLLFRVTAAGQVLPVTPNPSLGSSPNAGLLLATDGALFGTLAFGGGAFTDGVVFRRTATGITSWLFGRGSDLSNPFPNGRNPAGELAEGEDGSIYGTAMNGGGAGFDGVLFRIAPLNNAIDVVHRFSGLTGAVPKAGLTRGADGAIYGTTTAGGEHQAGTLFRFTVDGSFQVLHHFSAPDGSVPEGRLFEASPGVFMGTTSTGGDHGNGVVYRLTVAPADTLAPVLHLPSDIVRDAADPAGVAVDYVVTADDDTDEDPVVTCVPASGTVFPLGETVVNCTARDASGNESAGNFRVTVRDGRGVEWTLTYPAFVEATGPTGAVVNYTISASGAVPPNPVITCSFRSGLMFGLGPTEITCRTFDVNGDVASVFFTVTVRDTTAPVLTVPASFEIEPYAANNTLQFVVTANDLVDPAPVVACLPPAGSTLTPDRVIAVSCTARDASNNVSAPSAFTVTVLGVDDVLERIARQVESYNLGRAVTLGITQPLRASAAILRRTGRVVCAHMTVAEAQIAAVAGTGIPRDDALEMMQTLSTIFTSQSCWGSLVPGR